MCRYIYIYIYIHIIFWSREMRIIPSPQRLGTAFFWCLSQVASEGLPPSLQAGPWAKVSGGFTTRKPWDAMFHIIMYIYTDIHIQYI